jgi:hypothetical protein
VTGINREGEDDMLNAADGLDIFSQKSKSGEEGCVLVRS